MSEGGEGASKSTADNNSESWSRESLETPNSARIFLAESKVSIPPSRDANFCKFSKDFCAMPFASKNSDSPSQSPLSSNLMAVATGGSGSPSEERPSPVRMSFKTPT